MPFFLNIEPNWRDPVKETFSFDTGIYESHDRSEVRTSFRPRPKWVLEFNTLLTESRSTSLLRAVTKDRREVVHIPNPLVFGATTGWVESGSNFFPMTTGPLKWLIPGELVAADGRLYEIVSKVAQGIFVAPRDEYLNPDTTPIDRMPPGMIVRKVVSGRLTPQQTISWETSRVGQSAVVFTMEPHLQPVSTSWPPQEYEGLRLWGLKPNWRSGVQASFDSLRDEFEGISGVTDYDWRAAYPMRTWAAEFSGVGDARLISSFFCWCRGRQKSFYFPDLTSPIFPAGGVNTVTNSIRVKGVLDSFSPSNDSTMKFVLINTAKGSFIRKLVSATQGQSEGFLYLKDPAPFTCSREEVFSVQALFQSRFLEDTMTVEWLTSTYGVVNVQTRSIDYKELMIPSALITENGLGIVNELGTLNITTG